MIGFTNLLPGVLRQKDLVTNFLATIKGKPLDATMGKQLKDELNALNSDLGGYKFDTINGVPSYKAGADAVWVPFKREPIIEKASFSWAYSPSQTFPAKEGYEIVGLYADITGINSNSAVNINFGISKNLAAGRIAISGQTYVNIMGAFYCIYA